MFASMKPRTKRVPAATVIASLMFAACTNGTQSDAGPDGSRDGISVDALADGANDLGSADAGDADLGDALSDADDAAVDTMPERTGRVIVTQTLGAADSNPTATATAQFVETSDGPRCP